MTEDKILAGNFLFVSYSHKDMDSVREDVRALHNRGARIWFDENMRISDNWKEIAASKIAHPNCRGVIFYNSEAAFLSEAVSLERQKAAKRNHAEKDFGIFSINLEGKSMQNIYAGTLPMAPHDFLAKMQSELLPLFNDDILYIPRFDSQTCVEDIYEKIVRPQLAVDEVGLFKDALKSRQSATRKTDLIHFGSYFGTPYSAPLKHSLPTERFTSNGAEYISYNNKLFELRPLTWDILYAENATAVLLCTEIVDVCCGGASAKEYLKEVFAPLAFSEQEKNLMNANPRLLTPIDIQKAKEMFMPEGKHASRHWWVDAPGLMEHWQMTYCGRTPYQNGFNVTIKKGIRPVIEVPFDKLQ